MEFSLAAVKREELGKEKATKLRQQGEVPGVLYSQGKPTEHITVNALDFGKLLHRGGGSKLIKLMVKTGKGEQQEHVLVKEFQRHPVKGNVLHVDFLRVALDHQVTLKVKVHLSNEEKRERDGAILELLLHELEISCLPTQIPNQINVDVSPLTIGNGIHVKDLQLPEGVKVLNSLEEMVVLAAIPAAIVEPTVAETEVAAAGEAPAEAPAEAEKTEA